MARTIKTTILILLILTLLLPSLFACSQSDLVVLKTKPKVTDNDGIIVDYVTYSLGRYEYIDMILDADLYEDFIPAHAFGSVGTLYDTIHNPKYCSWDYNFENGTSIVYKDWDGYYDDIVGIAPCYEYGGKSTEFNQDELYTMKTKLKDKSIWIEVFDNVFYGYYQREENDLRYFSKIKLYVHDKFEITISFSYASLIAYENGDSEKNVFYTVYLIILIPLRLIVKIIQRKKITVKTT